MASLPNQETTQKCNQSFKNLPVPKKIQLKGKISKGKIIQCWEWQKTGQKSYGIKGKYIGNINRLLTASGIGEAPLEECTLPPICWKEKHQFIAKCIGEVQYDTINKAKQYSITE